VAAAPKHNVWRAPPHAGPRYTLRLVVHGVERSRAVREDVADRGHHFPGLLAQRYARHLHLVAARYRPPLVSFRCQLQLFASVVCFSC
jgi:hypothetical protein